MHCYSQTKGQGLLLSPQKRRDIKNPGDQIQSSSPVNPYLTIQKHCKVGIQRKVTWSRQVAGLVQALSSCPQFPELNSKGSSSKLQDPGVTDLLIFHSGV